MTNTKNTPRSTFSHGADIDVRFAGYADNQGACVDVWALRYGETYFTVNLILPHSAPDGAEWNLSSIQKPQGEPVWSFKDDRRKKQGFFGFTQLAEVHDVTYVVFLTKGALRIMYVVPLLYLIDGEPDEAPEEVIKRKVAVADELRLPVFWVGKERALHEKMQEEAAMIRRIVDRSGDKVIVKVTDMRGGTPYYEVREGAVDGKLLSGSAMLTLAKAREMIGKVIEPPKPEGHGVKTNVPDISQKMAQAKASGGGGSKKAA